MYDYYLGGKNHYPADRKAADQIIALYPDVATWARDNRAFLQRAVRTMAESGIRQFLDLGAGLPTQQNVHQVAQAADPEARVVYVDNDPVTLAHARALLVNDDQTTVVEADLRYPEYILSHPEVTRTIDLGQPLGVLMVAILHFVTDDEDPAAIVSTFRDAVPSGSCLAVSHGTADDVSEETKTQGRQVYEQASSTLNPRTREQIRGLFAGFEILDPGIVPVQRWRTETTDTTSPHVTAFAGFGCKP